MATLSYLGNVNIAIRFIDEKYPGSKLYEVDGLPIDGPTTDYKDIQNLRVVCTTGKGTAIIHSKEWGEWGLIDYIDQPWLEDQVIKWPIEMELSEADELLKKAGHTGAYTAVTLRKPLYPGVVQPSYIFAMEDHSYVFVGVDDKKVTVNS